MQPVAGGVVLLHHVEGSAMITSGVVGPMAETTTSEVEDILVGLAEEKVITSKVVEVAAPIWIWLHHDVRYISGNFDK